MVELVELVEQVELVKPLDSKQNNIQCLPSSSLSVTQPNFSLTKFTNLTQVTLMEVSL